MSKLTKIALATFLFVSASTLAHAQVQWTTMAGCGTVLPGHTNVTMTADGFVSPSADDTGFVKVLYNLPLPSHLTLHSNTAMAVRFRDAVGAADWIIVRLKEYNPTTGLTYTRMIFNSNNFQSSNNWQEGWVTSSFDFDPYKIYYLEAELYRNSLTPPPPILCSIRLWRY